MTLYICECPHRMPATVWTAASEAQARALIDAAPGADLVSVLQDDNRDAYVTSDPLDLYFWISHAEAPQATGARQAFMRSSDARHAVLQLGRRADHGDDIRYTAFEGRFAWSEDESEWTLDNQPPVKATDLFEALVEASLVIGRRDRLVQTDV